MGKVRAYDLAKELKIESRKVVEDARRLGVDISVPSNTIPDNIAAKIREMYYPKRKEEVTNLPRTARLIKHASSTTSTTPAPTVQAVVDAQSSQSATRVIKLAPPPQSAAKEIKLAPPPQSATKEIRLAPRPRTLAEPVLIPSSPMSQVRVYFEKARKSRASELNLCRMNLTFLHEDVGELPNLRGLHLNVNQIQELPESICRLSRLQHLDVSNNQLTVLPESVGQLSQLEYLDASNNHLATLPDSIGQLSQLRYLDLSNNHLKEIPESIGQLSKLQYLLLADNELSTLPESVKNLSFLQEFYLHGNSSLELPAEVLGQPWQDVLYKKAPPATPNDIIEYYARVRDEKHPLNEAKLILVGRGEVGKTSLVNRLVSNYYNKDEKKTDGINITGWQVTLNGDENVRLNIWDFGGQEIMHATHQFFLTERSLYLLVLNGRGGGEDTDADYWLKLIESFGSESPVLVVLNKIKEHPFDLNRRALQQKYPAIREFIKTDCENGQGINDLRCCIEREADRLDNLRAAFPARWFSIKDHLAGMEENYLTFDNYRKICRRLGETNAEAQDKLASYLHDLGIALNYKDDPRLQYMRVLSPQWVTNGIYGILNSEKLEKKKGEIHLNDLSGVIDGRKYNEEMRRFLFDLMRKFELCFSFPDDEFHYLIPELLDKQEPEETAKFNLSECLNFQYDYEILPEGLLPRFIVRTNSLSEGQWRWRTGVILKFENCRALIKADVQDRKVFIHVSGPVASRRRLLAIIRSDFERIHRDIRNLNPKEMVPLPGYPKTVVPYNALLVREQKGTKRFTEVIGDDEIELDVQELLNGVDIEGARKREMSSEAKNEPVRVFISYSHKDEQLRNDLETHLKLLQRQGLIESWQDRQIEAGDEWKRRIDDNLASAEIILLLISSDFIASDYCYEIEMKRAMERHENKEARVIPIIVRDISWGKAPFARLQALPIDGKAIALWENKDTAWRNVSDGIEKVLFEFRK